MSNPYTSVAVASYNANPPSDDGQQTADNQITWDKHKTKLGDPLKTALESINTNVNTAVGKLAGAIVTATIDTALDATHQGKTIVVSVAGVTITTPSASVVGTPFACTINNISSGDITVDGSGSQTIDGLASLSVRSGGGVDLQTDGTNWFTGGRNYDLTRIQPQGYLTPTSATPSIVSDVSAGTSVYYAIDKGNLVPTSDGSTITIRKFAQLTLTLNSNHVANAIYDVFLFMNSGTLTIGTGPAWNTATAGSGARGTGAGTTELDRIEGLWANKVQITARNGATTYTVAALAGIYVGSIYMDGTNGQITCHRSFGQNRKWGIWNAYNRKPLVLKAGDATANWSYNTTTIRQSNGATGNKATVFCGLADEMIDAWFTQNFIAQTGEQGAIGIGWNSTTAFTGLTATGGGGESMALSLSAKHSNTPFLGIANVNCCERSNTGANDGFYGSEANMLLEVRWQG